MQDGRWRSLQEIADATSDPHAGLLMIAAIYARKSTEAGVADDQRSVSRQVEHARACAEQKGWTVDASSI
jgi:hypothetical protein